MHKRLKKLSAHNFLHYLLTVTLETFKAIVGSSYWIILGIAGWLIFRSKISPFDLVVGLPVLIIAIGLIANSLDTVFLAIFSPKFNRGVCRLCDKK